MAGSAACTARLLIRLLLIRSMYSLTRLLLIAPPPDATLEAADPSDAHRPAVQVFAGALLNRGAAESTALDTSP
jgi:hypothetical protein